MLSMSEYRAIKHRIGHLDETALDLQYVQFEIRLRNRFVTIMERDNIYNGFADSRIIHIKQ